MLLINGLKECKLINLSIRTMKQIMFEHRDRPICISYEIRTRAIFEFKESTFSEGTKWRTDLDKKSRSN